MNLPWHTWCGLIGVLLILLAYVLLQLEQLRGHSLGFQSLNAVGALGVLLALLFGSFNLFMFLITAAWLAISVFGMVVGARRRA